MVKEIPLTQGKVALVDDCDYEELAKYKWHAASMGRKKITYYAMRQNSRYTRLRMHDVILPHVGKSLVVDHIDGDPLNNQRSNLRLVTQRQNSQNRHHKKSSEYCGVTKRKNGWEAQIRYLGKKRYLGFYENEVDAHVVYLVADKVLVGIQQQEG